MIATSSPTYAASLLGVATKTRTGSSAGSARSEPAWRVPPRDGIRPNGSSSAIGEPGPAPGARRAAPTSRRYAPAFTSLSPTLNVVSPTSAAPGPEGRRK